MMSSEALEKRVVAAAEAALAERGYVAPLDVLVGVGWLAREDKLCFVEERGVMKLALQTQTAPR